MLTEISLHLLVAALFLDQKTCGQRLIDASGCGRTKGCWIVPPDCRYDLGAANASSSAGTDCLSMVTWAVSESADALVIEMESLISDLKTTPFSGRYVALAFSKDRAMGDDSVVECVSKPDGTILAFMSFNDETSNHRLHEASAHLLNNTIGSVVDGRMMCRTERSLKNTDLRSVPQSDLFKIFDLTHSSYNLQMARGKTKHGIGFDLGIHGTDDGPLFPWTTTEKVNASETKVIHLSKQTDIPRYVQYNLVKVHGIFMIFGWWVFGSIAMLLSRFMKHAWPGTKLFGSAVWFQLHRCLMLAGLVLQSIAFAFVFIQAGDFKMCAYKCTAESYALKLHTILGVTCMSAALLQPFLAWIRPIPTSSKRPIFNWLHWFIGTGSWIIACVTIIQSPLLGKAGLRRNFGYQPDYLMAGYVASFIMTSILLEIISAYYHHKDEYKHYSIPMTALNGPRITKATAMDPDQSYWMQPLQFTILLLFTCISSTICIALSIMIALNRFM